MHCIVNRQSREHQCINVHLYSSKIYCPENYPEVFVRKKMDIFRTVDFGIVQFYESIVASHLC